MSTLSAVCVYAGEDLARYGFGHGHPFGPDRLYAFWDRLREKGLDSRVRMATPVTTDAETIELFHSADYVRKVQDQSRTGEGFLDYGDTPAFEGVFEAACFVVGSGLDAVERILAGECRRAFVPIGGLHHAGRNSAAGFCVFNDCGVVIEALRRIHGLRRLAYVDIDAHHGNGVFYAFEEDPDLAFCDLHEDGRFLYPGTGDIGETGRGAAAGTKLNVPMPPHADDTLFRKIWPRVEAFLSRAEPEFILFQCGADSLAGDPITHLQYTSEAHALAAASLCRLADRFCNGRLLAFGGGGYNRDNLAEAWTRVVEVLAAPPEAQ